MTTATLYSPSGGSTYIPPATAGANVPEAVKAKLKGKSDEFEAYFVQQFIDLSAPDQSDDPLQGGGTTESFYTQKMHEQVAKAVVARGGLGLSKQVYGELLKMQEGKYPAAASGAATASIRAALQPIPAYHAMPGE